MKTVTVVARVTTLEDNDWYEYSTTAPYGLELDLYTLIGRGLLFQANWSADGTQSVVEVRE